MLIDTREKNGVTLALINTRRIEARIADPLAAGLLEAIGKARGVVLDFAQVGFIDSTGMKALMTVLLHCRKSETPCALMGVSEDIMSVFVITRLNRLLPITGSEDEAVDKVRELLAQARERREGTAAATEASCPVPGAPEQGKAGG
ncbi:hypothetical protein NNJEOMEG_01966 [Fundidesulfovibrio magnetotacticus]|uniref:STAS domain-containing protein n=1 Tax=Fundidesulfovibrio magnetotacticus TaxID=2730080 RepID=A0A6V8LWT5_9BACT|nr:STAS domain-containing protein [Fundidesulfovibrio magnetotacticus]GFK94127.1 hypothetical protein NNJEOMEG_01966 [Fundidesulfovibrio magnetotacticus]